MADGRWLWLGGMMRTAMWLSTAAHFELLRELLDALLITKQWSDVGLSFLAVMQVIYSCFICAWVRSS